MDNLIYGRIPLSAEIQAFAYRNVLRIIKETGCGYDEAWNIFKKEFEKKMNATVNHMQTIVEKTNDQKTKGAKRQQQNQYKPKMDGNRNQDIGVREDHRPQREVRPVDDPTE